MSRLDSFIRRLWAQKACIELCAGKVEGLSGVVVELGLGNGRTFDHLREVMHRLEIFVLERQPNAMAASTPDADHLLIGTLDGLLPTLAEKLPEKAIMLHSDIGCGDPEIDKSTAALISREVSGFLAVGGWVASDQPLDSTILAAQSLPEGVADGRYFIYRRI